jgi:DNA-directed RNA polymerase delta subunit
MKTIIPVTKAAEEILEKSGKPMHYMEITKLILRKCDLHGKTPDQSVCSRISTNSKFVRVAEGVYALSKWKNYTRIRFAKDIAYDILKSKGESLSLKELGIKVFEERPFRGSPKAVIRNSIRRDGRFYLDNNSELVSLAEWNKT